MSATDELLDNNRRFAESFDKGDLALGPPAKGAVVIACMDARVNPYAILGLQEGDAHVIRNAGGVITDDAIRSVAISQHLLGTQEVILLHHTDCGMLTFTDDEFKGKLGDATGEEPDWPVNTFSDPDADVRESIRRLTESPFIPNKDSVRGFVYDVKTGAVREVSPE